MNQIDKIFKHRLEHHTTDVPAGAWETISARLDAEATRPKRPFLLLMSIFVLFMAGTTASYYYLNPAPPVAYPVAAGSSIDLASDITSNNVSAPRTFTGDNSSSSATNIEIPSLETGESRSKRVLSPVISSTANTSDIAPATGINATVGAIANYGVIAEESTESMAARENIEVQELGISASKVRFFREFKFMALPSREKQAAACPFRSNINDKSLDVYYSSDFGHRILQSNDPSYQGHIDARNRTETPGYSFSAGLRFGYNVGFRWNLYTGFNYSQLNEKFEYIDPESNQIRIITIKDYIYENGKIVDSVLTEEKVVVPGTTIVKVYNKYRSFDLPVLARYTLFANKDLSLSAIGGLYINLAFSEKGMMLGKNEEVPVRFTSQDTDPKGLFKSQAGVTPYAAFSLAYHLNGNMDLLLEPNARFQTRSLTSDQYPVSQKFNTYGITTGLRYKF